MRDLSWVGGRPVITERPLVCTPRQARLAMAATPSKNPSFQNLLDEAEFVIASIPLEAEQRAAIITWEYATQFTRYDPLIDKIGASCGLNKDEIDQVFMLAMSM